MGVGVVMMVMVVVMMVVVAGAAAEVVPFIVVQKKATVMNRMKKSEGGGAERVSVSIDIYNQGSSSAYDVTLIDEHWSPQVFDLIKGNTTHSWERLDAGGILSHSFELEAKVKGLYHAPPALVTFRVPTKAALQEAYSTPIFPLDVLAERPPEKKFEWAKRLLAKYGSLISVISIVVLFVYLVATPSKSNAAKGSKKRR